MTARDDVRRKAGILGWGVNESYLNDTLIRADRMIHVEYRKDGAINRADLYQFYSINNPIPLETVGDGKHKKETVFSWLAST